MLLHTVKLQCRMVKNTQICKLSIIYALHLMVKIKCQIIACLGPVLIKRFMQCSRKNTIDVHVLGLLHMQFLENKKWGYCSLKMSTCGMMYIGKVKGLSFLVFFFSKLSFRCFVRKLCIQY